MGITPGTHCDIPAMSPYHVLIQWQHTPAPIPCSYTLAIHSCVVAIPQTVCRELATSVANWPHQSRTAHISRELATSVANWPHQSRTAHVSRNPPTSIKKPRAIRISYPPTPLEFSLPTHIHDFKGKASSLASHLLQTVHIFFITFMVRPNTAFSNQDTLREKARLRMAKLRAANASKSAGDRAESMVHARASQAKYRERRRKDNDPDDEGDGTDADTPSDSGYAGDEDEDMDQSDCVAEDQIESAKKKIALTATRYRGIPKFLLTHEFRYDLQRAEAAYD
ncbi:hypothetical protein IMY05_C1150000700 [Salix suchowensis]|nr:hypothetical protein IMY05_C1150000700 [Salix suchowensis]